MKQVYKEWMKEWWDHSEWRKNGRQCGQMMKSLEDHDKGFRFHPRWALNSSWWWFLLFNRSKKPSLYYIENKNPCFVYQSFLFLRVNWAFTLFIFTSGSPFLSTWNTTEHRDRLYRVSWNFLPQFCVFSGHTSESWSTPRSVLLAADRTHILWKGTKQGSYHSEKKKENEKILFSYQRNIFSLLGLSVFRTKPNIENFLLPKKNYLDWLMFWSLLSFQSGFPKEDILRPLSSNPTHCSLHSKKDKHSKTRQISLSLRFLIYKIGMISNGTKPDVVMIQLQPSRLTLCPLLALLAAPWIH